MAKVKNKKKAFKHRLKKQGLFNNLKAPVPPVAPQPLAETKTVAKEEVAAKDLSLEAFAELPEVEGLRSNLVETLYNEGLTSVAAFATVTEEEVLALKGVGPATVKKLKENGVYGLSVPFGTNDMMGTRFLNFYVRSGGGSLLTKDLKANLTSKLAQDGIK